MGIAAALRNVFGSGAKEMTGGTRILNSADLAAELGAYYEADAGVSVTPTTAMQHSAVFSCVRVLAENIGMLPLKLYKRNGDRREEQMAHAIHRLIAIEPNHWQTPQEYWETVVAHLALRGNHFSLKTRSGSGSNTRIRELLPLDPDSVEVMQDERFQLSYKIKLDGQAEQVYGADRIFHIPLFSLDGFTGVSPISYGRNSIGMGIASERHGSKIFKSGGRVSGILSTDQSLTKEQRTQLRESWDSAYGGVNNDIKTAVLSGGLTWKQVALTSVDAQYIEQRKFSRSDIAGLFRIPPHMIGDLENAHFNNVEHQFQEFVMVSLMPYLTRIEQRIRQQLLQTGEKATHFAKFNVNALLRGDTASRGEYYTRQIQNGVYSPNEVRAMEDENPRDGGDIYLTPVNMAIDGEIPARAGESASTSSQE